MGLLQKIFSRNSASEPKVGGMEDYMTLVRVYFQAALASQLGITNLAMLPDLRVFKQTMHVPTQNNKLGVGEKSYCKKMMKELYKTDDIYFKEIDSSIRKNCKSLQNVKNYLEMFQAFTQDLMMLTGNLMKFKLRVPGFFKKAIYTMTEKTVNDIFFKNDFRDPSVMKTALQIRQLNNHLNFSPKWVTAFVYQVVMLAKKEKPTKEQVEEAKRLQKGK